MARHLTDEMHTKKKTKIVFLANPNNPTGSFVKKSEIDKLAEGLKKHPHVTIKRTETLQYIKLLCNK